MSKRNIHGLNIPGGLLDRIRDNDEYENDDRFQKRRKTVSRKDRRKQDRESRKKGRQNQHDKHLTSYQALRQVQKTQKSNKDKHQQLQQKKQQDQRPKSTTILKKSSLSDDNDFKTKKRKKTVSFSDFDEIKEISGYLSSSSENDTFNENFYEDDEDLDDFERAQQEEVMQKLMALKGIRNSTTDTGLKIVNESDLDVDDDLNDSDLGDHILTTESDEDEDLDYEQQDIMKQLMALKGKRSASNIKVVKEDDLEKDEVSDLDDNDSESITESENDSNDEQSSSDTESLDDEQQDVMKQLMAIKGKSKSSNDIKLVKEDDMEKDEVSDLDEEMSDNSESDAEDQKMEDHGSGEESNDEDLDEEQQDVMKQLMALKGKRKTIGSQVKVVKEDDLEQDELSDLGSESEEESETAESQSSDEEAEKDISHNYPRFLSSGDRELLERDDNDIAYYARKLGITKNRDLKKRGDDDLIGGLLDGLDLDFGDDDVGLDEEEEIEEPKQKLKQKSKRYEEDFNEDDFDDDDDLDEEDKALLREMQGLQSSDEDSSDEDEDSDTPKVKENPYVAPVAVGSDSTGKYIPPSVRRRMALEQGSAGETEQMLNLMKSIKGPLNKLSEPNSMTIINELNQLYNDNPRQTVNEALLKVMSQSVLTPGPMLDSFLILYAVVIVSLFRLQSVEFGAYAIQTLVEKLNEYLKDESLAKGKEAVNLIGLIGYCYTFNLMAAPLIYGIVSEKLIKDPSEVHTALLLKLVKASGSKMRTDDPNALKQIIADLNKSIKDAETKGTKTSTRTKVLIDTMTNLKNNKLKNTENENSLQMIIRLKKQISRINANRNSDPIKVTLDDIEKIEERGKWWLVGSAWKGLDSSYKDKSDNSAGTEGYEVNDDLVNDVLDTAEPNWVELARQQRMNTDMRRAIFISIMSASDYMDSFAKLEKLRLKKTQHREVPNILLHCTAMEPIYNPYYGHLSKKLCEEHAMRKTFQFNLWDLFKELDGDEDGASNILGDDDEDRLKKILNLGRLYGTLVGEGSLPMHVLKNVNFLTASSDSKLFIEILLITFFDVVGKYSEEKAFGSGLASGKTKIKDLKFNDKTMIERLAKSKGEVLLLKGLQFFLTDKVQVSKLIKGKRQKARVSWGVESMRDVISGLLETSN